MKRTVPTNRPAKLCLLALLPMAAVAVAQEVITTKMMMREIEGTPGSVAVRAGKQKSARSNRKSHNRYVARGRDQKRYRHSVHGGYGAVMVSWNTSSAARARKAARLQREAAERERAAAARAARAAEARLAAAREVQAKREAARLAAIKHKAALEAAQRLAAAREAERKQQEAERLAAALRNGVRQNLTFAFVDPHHKAIVGVHLRASVETPEGGQKTLTNLQTDGSGHLRMANLQLPATVDFDVVGANGMPGTEKDDAEWDFAHVKDSTLLVASPLGTTRTVWNAGGPAHPRFASLRVSRNMLAESGLDGRPLRLAATTRMKIYEGALAPIVLERTVVDIAVSAPAGSTLTTAALPGRQTVVPETGKVMLRLPRAALAEGSLPIRAFRTLPGGESEAVLSDYGTDSYHLNVAAVPPLQLAKISDVTMPRGPGVLGTRDQVVAALGDLRGKSNKKNRLGKVLEVADGSEWWFYPAQGVAFKMRRVVGAKRKDKKAPMVVERVRMFLAEGGSLGGIHTGSTVDEMSARLGAPQEVNLARTPVDAADAVGQIDSWMDGGLRVCHNATNVLWVEAARTRPLLMSGTTAFIQHPRARLFIESFRGAARTNLESVNHLKAYLQQVQSVIIVPKREDADLVLWASVTFWQDWDKAAKLLPYKYNCSTTIKYTLSRLDDNGTRHVIADKTAVGKAAVDYTKELALVLGVTVGAHKKGGLLTDLLGGLGLAQLNQMVRKGANRCPAVSSRNAFGRMVHDIDEASDFTTRVTQIDYAAARLRLNAGSKAGLFVSTPARPCEFLLSVAGADLPSFESDRDSDYYVARVVQVDENSSLCELRHLHRHIGRNGKEGFKDEPALDMLRCLPDAATGVTGARAAVQFPPVTIVTEAAATAATKRQEESNNVSSGI